MSIKYSSCLMRSRAGRLVRTVACLLLVSHWSAGITPRAQAATADMRFDAPFLVSCRDVTTDEFAASNPHERLVEARFEITALPTGGQSSQDLQYLYRFISPAGTVQIVDYEPRTSQATSLAGNVSVEKTKEASKSLVASLSGGFAPLAQGSASADMAGKRTEHIRYELKPPMEVILVAGTVQRGTGVYFQLLPAAETAWEGSREFVLVLRVPRDWRGDIMYVRCEAQQDERGRTTSRGVSRFVVGLHLAGDEAARMAAEQLNLAEAALRRSVARRQQDIQRRAMPTVIHRMGALLDMYDPKIPDTWLDRLVYGPTQIADQDFVGYLPDDVRRLADRYVQAKRRMYDLTGSRLARHHDDLALETR